MLRGFKDSHKDSNLTIHIYVVEYDVVIPGLTGDLCYNASYTSDYSDTASLSEKIAILLLSDTSICL